MKTTLRNFGGSLVFLAMTSAALASDAETSATAGSNAFDRNGTAAATAAYDGQVGFARTDADSGRINRAHGVAVGFDRDGLSLSVSNAIASRFGPAIGSNFNVSIGLDGRVSTGRSLAISRGPLSRSVSVGGRATADHHRGNTAASIASGFRRGAAGVPARVRVESHSRSYRRVVRVAPQPRLGRAGVPGRVRPIRLRLDD
jgi:hypothetical protein